MKLKKLRDNDYMLRNEDKIVGCFLYDCYDEEIARIDALFVDPESFALRYCMITIGGLLGTRGKTLLLPKGILERKGIGKVSASKSQAVIFDAPAPSDAGEITQAEELEIHGYFDVQPYFDAEEEVKDGEEG
ncbi:MAG: hypothetical protein HZA01_10375 [Nitrospinae bacterium]|nr:hypothetical protein [Nitrospinota bacterium]